MMNGKILLVERNPRIIEMLVEAFVRRFDAQITCVSIGEDALDVEIFEPHAIAVVDTNLDGIDALTLAARLRELSDRPVILMGQEPSAADLIQAMRSGVSDFFAKPFPIETLLERMTDLVQDHTRQLTLIQRHERTRTLLRKVIRERRQLNDRVELICKDLVGAHKRLATRVLTHAPRSA